MPDYEREIERMRMLHYAVGLPVCLTEGEKRIFSMPEVIQTAADIGGGLSSTQPAAEESPIAQYIRTEAGENFILLTLPEGATVTVGPFLVERVPDGFVTELARREKIRLRDREAVQRHYASLPLVTKQRFFYVGRLMEELFLSEAPVAAPPAFDGTAAAFIQPEFYRQTRDYRVQQFRHSPYHVEQEICRAISSGDSAEAHRILREINSRPRARLAGTAMRSMKNSVICSCCFMTRAAISGGVDPDEAFTLSDAFIQAIERCQDFRELSEMEGQIVSGFVGAVRRTRGARYSSAVRQTIGYIDTHLCEPLSVRSVAEAVYLSSSYLSTLFKSETGETLHGYIIRRRIEESSYFIRNTADPIADIASFYQFSSQSHYVRSFRKLMGITPGAYRKNADGSGTES